MKKDFLLRYRSVLIGLQTAALSLTLLSGAAVAQDLRCQESVVVGYFSSVSAISVAVQDDLAYIASPRNGLTVVDISDRTNPTAVGFADSQLILNRISLSGDIAAVKTRDTGILIFDVSDATTPLLTGHIQSGREHNDIVLNGSTLYASRIGAGIEVYDLSDLSQPSLVTTFGDSSIIGRLDLDGDTLYVAASQVGLVTLDVSDPTQPQLLSQFDVTQDQRIVSDLSVRQGVAVVNLAGEGVALVDVTDPRNPVRLSFFPDVPDGYGPFSIAIDGDRVYLSFIGDALYVFDIANLFAPELIGKYSGLDGVLSMDFDGDNGYVGLGSQGFQIIDVSSPDLVTPLRHDFELFGSPLDVGLLADGSSLLVSDSTGGLFILDVSDPGSMQLVSEFDLDGDEGRFTVRGVVVYIAAGEAGVHVLGLPNPDFSVLLATIDTPGEAVAVELAGTLAFISDQSGGVHIVDIFNASEPVILSSFQTPSRVTDVRVKNGIAYVNDPQNGVYILDVSTPSQPVLLGQTNSQLANNPQRIELVNDVLYVGFGTNTVRMYDVSDPAQPTEIGSHFFGHSTSDTVVVDDTMYIGGGAIYTVDISDPARIEQLAQLDAGFASGLFISDGWLFVADQTAELHGDGFGAVIALDLNDCRAFCPADLNQDQILNLFDVAVFLVAFAEQDLSIDFNQDGEVNFFDVPAFIASFQAGCP